MRRSGTRFLVCVVAVASVVAGPLVGASAQENGPGAAAEPAVVVGPDGVFRAREVDHDGKASSAPRIYIERNVEAAGLGDYDADGDGWALLGRTNGAGDNGRLARFWVQDGVPYAATRHHKKGCLTLTPKTLEVVKKGQTRFMDQVADTANCRDADPSADVDGDGTPDDVQDLYRVTDDGRRLYLQRNTTAAEAQLGVSDWDPDADGWSAYARTNGSGEYGTFIRLDEADDGSVSVWVEHRKKGCTVLAPNRTDTVAKGQTRRLKVAERIGGACPDGEPVDTTAPPVPSGLAATARDGMVQLSWGPVEVDDLLGYRVYQTTDPDGPWEEVTTSPATSPEYTVEGLANGTTYWFAVNAEDTAGNLSDPSAAATATPTLAGLVVPVAVELPQGSTVQVGAPPFTRIDSLEPETESPGLTFTTTEAAGFGVAAGMGVATGTYQVPLVGSGCIQADCDQPLVIEAEITVQPIGAPSDEPLASLDLPSPDRVDQALELERGIGVQLLDELIVVLGTAETPGTRPRADDLAATYGAVVSGGSEAIGVFQFRWPEPVDIDTLVAQLEAEPDVAGVDLALLVENSADVTLPPGDWDDDATNATWPFILMRAPQAWNTVNEVSVPVGIVDGQLVDRDHPDLNVTTVTHTGSTQEGEHATHVAGLACAEANGEGLVGVAWGCPIISDAEDTVLQYRLERLDSAVLAAERVIDAGARVVNMSIGIGVEAKHLCADQALADKIDEYADDTAESFRRLAEDKGEDVVFTLSAGNHCKPGTSSPWGRAADLPNVITVASIDSDMELSSFSNWGEDVEVAAPGGFALPDQPDYLHGIGVADRDGNPVVAGEAGVWSTLPGGTYGDTKVENGAPITGTSMAAPMVAGVAALVRQKYPLMTAADVGRCIQLTAGTNTDGATKISDYPLLNIFDEKYEYPPRIQPPDGGIDVPIVDAAAAVTCDAQRLSYDGGTWVIVGYVGEELSSAPLPYSGGLGTVEAAVDSGSPPGWLSIGAAASELRPTGVPTSAGEWSFEVRLTDEFGDSVTIPVRLTVPEPIDPPDDPDGDFIARDPNTGRAVRVVDGTAYDIPDGGTFLCLAATRVVWDRTDHPALAQNPAGDTGCDNTGRLNWNVEPASQGGNIGTDVIVRNQAEPASNWLINNAGEIQTIPDGGTYLCLAASNPVIWNVPQTVVDAWPDVGGEPATCGARTADVQAGYMHTCALDDDGQAWCWGSVARLTVPDSSPELEEPYYDFGDSPVAVPGGRIFTSLADSASASHACGLDSQGNAWCWGNNDYGQLGNGQSEDVRPYSETPVQVAGGRSFDSLAVGLFHTCGLDASGAAWCWGLAEPDGMFEIPSEGSIAVTPVRVGGDIRFSSLVTSILPFTCGIDGDGKAWCWDYRNDGRWDADDLAWEPVGPSGSSWTSLRFLLHLVFGLDDSGSLRFLAAMGRSGTEVAKDESVPVIERTFTEVKVGGGHVCGIEADGDTWCWGSDEYGQLGDGLGDSSSDDIGEAWVQVAGGRTFTHLSPGAVHTCGIDNGGQTWCWGNDEFGQLGDGADDGADEPSPVRVVGR